MRHVIVTGGSRGLGIAFVEGLLNEGYLVSTCSRSSSSALERLKNDERFSGRLFWMPCTVGKPDEVDRFVNGAMEWSGEHKLYGLINNAGIAPEGVLATFPHVAMEQVLEVNLLGALQMTRAALRHLLRSKNGGRIINVSSIIGRRGYTGLAAYSATKAGLDGMTRSLARELGRRGITVNSVAPGYLRTEISATLSDAQLDQIARRTPVGRLGEPRDVLPVVQFLLRDEARFVTGQVIVVDGGLSA